MQIASILRPFRAITKKLLTIKELKCRLFHNFTSPYCCFCTTTDRQLIVASMLLPIGAVSPHSDFRCHCPATELKHKACWLQPFLLILSSLIFHCYCWLAARQQLLPKMPHLRINKQLVDHWLSLCWFFLSLFLPLRNKRWPLKCYFFRFILLSQHLDSWLIVAFFVYFFSLLLSMHCFCFLTIL